MGFVLHGDFTLQRTITLAVLDARMSLTPSLNATCVPGCTTSFFPSGDMVRYCHQEIACYTTWSPGCSCGTFNMELWFQASLTHLSMPIINTALILQTLGTLVIVWQEGFDSWPSLLPTPARTKQFVLRCTLLASRATLSVFPNPSPDILFSPMIVPSQKNLAMIIMGGLFFQMVVLALWMVKPLLDWCQNTLQQHRWNDCHDWSIFVSWFSRSCHSWWTVTYFLWFHACCWYLSVHDPGPHSCAAGACLSTVYDSCSAQTTTHHAARVWS